MLRSNIVRFLNFFDTIGFNSGSSKLSNYPKLIKFIVFVEVVIGITIIILKFQFLQKLYSLYGLLPTINEGCMYSASLYTYLLIVFDSINSRRAHRNFWRLLVQIDEQYCTRLNLRFRIYTLKMAEFVFVVNLLGLLSIYDVRSTQTLFTYILFMVLTRWFHFRVFYYLFCLEIVHFQMTNIEQELIRLQSQQWSDSHRLKRIREHLSLVHRMTCNLNEIFGWSNVAVILSCFYYLLNTVNWIFITFGFITLKYYVGEMQKKI